MNSGIRMRSEMLQDDLRAAQAQNAALRAERDAAYAKGRADMLRDAETWLELHHPIVGVDLHDAFTPRRWEKGGR